MPSRSANGAGATAKLRYTGHVLAEDLPGSMSVTNGSVLRYYEQMDAPGMDLLNTNDRSFWTAKQVASTARQFGKKWMLSELYGCTGWQMGFDGHKEIGDWQGVSWHQSPLPPSRLVQHGRRVEARLSGEHFLPVPVVPRIPGGGGLLCAGQPDYAAGPRGLRIFSSCIRAKASGRRSTRAGRPGSRINRPTSRPSTIISRSSANGFSARNWISITATKSSSRVWPGSKSRWMARLNGFSSTRRVIAPSLLAEWKRCDRPRWKC